MTDSSTETRVKLPSIKELTIGLPTYEQPQYQPIRHHSIGSSSTTSPQQIYYHVHSHSQPSLVLPQHGLMSTNSSISPVSSTSIDVDPLSSRKSSVITTSRTPPYQSSTFPSTNTSITPGSGNYVIANPQYDMLNYKIQQTHPVNPFEQVASPPYRHQPFQQHHHRQQQPQPQQQQLHHQHIPSTQPKKKRPRRKANEMERLYACNWKNCKNSYGTLNHLNAHITFKRHGPKRKPEEFKQIRELYKLKKTKLERAKQEAMEEKEKTGSTSDANIKLLANLSESFFDSRRTGAGADISSKIGDIGITGSNHERDIAELPIFHQQRGYNGYGRHSYTLKQAGDNEQEISVNGE